MAAFARARPCYSGLRASLMCCPVWQLVVVAVCQLLIKTIIIITDNNYKQCSQSFDNSIAAIEEDNGGRRGQDQKLFKKNLDRMLGKMFLF